ncbi:MAG: PhnD/SsuA/transferrin family substrate-binding protein [Anaerolineales bacterium]|jgi:phosphonate transport system substrate-binding protein
MTDLGKRLFYVLNLFLLMACSLTINSASETTPEPVSSPQGGPAMETALAVAAATANIPRPTPTAAPLGTTGNPLVVALSPGSASDGDRVEAGKAFAEQLSEVTGYNFVVVAPDSYANLVRAMGHGNVHVAVLSPYAYGFAYKQGFASAAFARVDSGEKAYGAQFIARTDAGFQSYFDAFSEENRGDASMALSQFRDKKPCWPDEVSPSGYVIPAGILSHNNISLDTAAILQGQPTVVRAVYVGGICDFGATYIDARTFPIVLDEYPDVLEEVEIIWRVPPVIPYEVLTISPNMPPKIDLSIRDALFRITGMQAGRQVLGQAYGIEEWERITDAFYDEFRLYLDASGVDLESLINFQS